MTVDHQTTTAATKLGEGVGDGLAWAHVDHDAIAQNVRTLARRAGVPLMAVVKADAFGHGAAPVARTCLAAGADALGVTRIGEALALRAAGLTAPILAWLFDIHQAGVAVAAGVELSVTRVEQLDAVVSLAASPGCGRPLPRVHLELDTGMNRAGCPGEHWAALTRRAAHLSDTGRLIVAGVWSHLSHGGDPQAIATHRQLLMYRVGLDLARAAGLRGFTAHLANTAAVQSNPALTRHGMVRVGAGLYGIGPGLRPAMTVRSRLVQTRRAAAGRGVGYDHHYRTARTTRLGLVPLGYADGIPRAVEGRAALWVAGRRVPVVGRISMDQVVVDLGDGPGAVGDEVTVFGPGEHGEPSVADWATWADTIEHEIYTGLGERIERRHTTSTHPFALEVPTCVAPCVSA